MLSRNETPASPGNIGNNNIFSIFSCDDYTSNKQAMGTCKNRRICKNIFVLAIFTIVIIHLALI
eukprot:Awhi_evm1s13582